MLAVVRVSLKRNFTGLCNATHVEKAIFQKCVQSPAQITAPGFVLGDVIEVLVMGRRFCTRMLRGQMETEERCSRPRVILLVQLKAEKIPVNFPLFTGKLNSTLL
jgi:hypothetical protein